MSGVPVDILLEDLVFGCDLRLNLHEVLNGIELLVHGDTFSHYGIFFG